MKYETEKQSSAGPGETLQRETENIDSAGEGTPVVSLEGGAKEKVGKNGRRYIPPFQGGEVFGRLTVLTFSHTVHKTSPAHHWNCLCECGRTITAERGNLISGRQQSCGCFRDEKIAQLKRTHGESYRRGKSPPTPEYRCWSGILSRCENPKVKHYQYYGGRGIKVSERWRTYENFLEDMGRKPSPEHSIDRINVNGDYETSNCRWATKKEQDVNRRNNVILTHNGYSATQSQWAERTGMTQACIYRRLKKGWSVEAALTTPQIRRGPRK